MGKNISGSGMDTNVIGRIYTRGQEEPEVPEVTWIGVLNLTSESHGNAVGIGYADLTTKRLVDSADLHAVYTNAITAVVPSLAKIPMMMSSDKELVETAVKFMEPKAADEIRLVRVRSTLELQIVDISEAIWSEIETDPKFEALGDGRELEFDEAGSLVPLSWPETT